MRRHLLSALLISTLSAPVSAADLLDIYRMAQDSDPTFQSAAYAYQAVRQRVPEALSALVPAFGVTASTDRTTGNTAYTGTPLVQRSFNSYVWSIQMTQPIFKPQAYVALHESYSLLATAAAQFRQAEQDLILRTARAYFDVLIAEESIAAADAEMNATGEQLVVAQKGFAKGTVAVTDVYEAQSRSDIAKSDRISAINDLEDKRAALEQIIGAVPQHLAALREEVVAPQPTPNDVTVWIQRAQSSSPAVVAAQAAVETAHSEVRKARYQRLPSVDFILSVGRNYSAGNIINPDDYSTNASDRQLGLQLTMPILDGGGMQAVVNETAANEKRAEADLEVAKRKAASDARSAFAGIANGTARISALLSAVTSGYKSTTGNRVGYQLGIRINSDVLDAERQLYSSKRDYAKARYDALYAGLQLKAAAGELVLVDVDLIRSFLIS